MVQWLKFGGQTTLRIIGSAPRDVWPKAFPRFRAVRDESSRGVESLLPASGARCRTQAALGSLPLAAVPAFAPPLETATSAGRNTRSPIM